MTTAVPRPSKSPRTRSGDACGDTGNRAGALRDQAILELVAGCGYIVVYTLCGFDRRARGLFGGPCFFARALMRTFIYVDGFNLYYGALKGTSWKWLDLARLSQELSATAPDPSASAALRFVGLLDVPSSTPPVPSGRAPCPDGVSDSSRRKPMRKAGWSLCSKRSCISITTSSRSSTSPQESRARRPTSPSRSGRTSISAPSNSSGQRWRCISGIS